MSFDMANKSSLEEKLFLVGFKPDEESHLLIKKPEICCGACAAKERPCTYACPAGVYTWEEDHISVAFEGCLECGCCRIVCPFANLEWRYPRGGFGVGFKQG